MQRPILTASIVTVAALGLITACSLVIIDTLPSVIAAEPVSEPQERRQHVYVTVAPTPETVIEYVDRVVTNEVLVEVPVTEYVDRVVEVPVEVRVEVPVTDAAALDAEYVSGYTDGRWEGEDWIASNWQRAIATPCPTEDSETCYWDAETMGNGEGTSFVNVLGTIYPLGGAS